MSKRILTGIQPSGILHIGNYFGAMKASIELQEQNPGNTFLFIADLHSLTVNPNPDDLRSRVQRLALDFLACGLDPEKTAFFRQSDINGVCELTWILNTITGLGLLERAHSYKDKVAKGFVPNNGLFSYPVLMAAVQPDVQEGCVQDSGRADQRIRGGDSRNGRTEDVQELQQHD